MRFQAHDVWLQDFISAFTKAKLYSDWDNLSRDIHNLPHYPLDKWHNLDYNVVICQHGGAAMMVRTRIFEFCYTEYRNLSELAQAMEISVSQVYRVREGKRHINQKFIVGAIRAFPNHKLDDLFYLVPESPTVTNDDHLHQYAAAQAPDKPAANEKQIVGVAARVVRG
jgi:hypothetical protein